ncbi:hypothetical protein ACET83_20720, partial [Aeromonas veronii]
FHFTILITRMPAGTNEQIIPLSADNHCQSAARVSFHNSDNVAHWTAMVPFHDTDNPVASEF